MATFYNPRLRWRAASVGIEERLAGILARWRGTPYRDGQATPGRQGGIYCSAFVARVLDELYRRSPTELPVIPRDISFHNPEGARAGLGWFLRAYPNHDPVEAEAGGYDVEPADVLIVGPINGGPGHAMMVGPRRNTLWEANVGIGVAQVGFAIQSDCRLYRIYRFRDRETWL